VHILGYWLNTDSGALLSHLAHFQQVRQSRIHEMVDRLNAAGVAITADAIFAVANCNSPGRPHVARALVAGGFVGDFDTAFDRFLKKGRPAWVPKARMDATVAVNLIHDAGGVAVLAHPGLYRNDQVIPRMAATGLDGLECWHTKHSANASEGYARTAAGLGLVATGGSDCHGNSKGAPLIGTVRLPYEQVDRLRERRPAPAGN
jgi:predicted metal-dependent phosphoesterase TrpH